MSLDVRRSKLAFWASISTRLLEYDNILCPSLNSNDLSRQALHKSSPLREDFKVTFKSVLRHAIICFDEITSRASLLKRVYILLSCAHFLSFVFTQNVTQWFLPVTEGAFFPCTFQVALHNNITYYPYLQLTLINRDSSHGDILQPINEINYQITFRKQVTNQKVDKIRSLNFGDW